MCLVSQWTFLKIRKCEIIEYNRNLEIIRLTGFPEVYKSTKYFQSFYSVLCRCVPVASILPSYHYCFLHFVDYFIFLLPSHPLSVGFAGLDLIQRYFMPCVQLLRCIDTCKLILEGCLLKSIEIFFYLLSVPIMCTLFVVTPKTTKLSFLPFYYEDIRQVTMNMEDKVMSRLNAIEAKVSSIDFWLNKMPAEQITRLKFKVWIPFEVWC